VVDGQFGPKTEMLLKQFQTSQGLAADGIAGPLTWHALPNGGPMPTLGEGSSGPVVTALQQLLTEAAFVEGASPGPADGIYGPRTKAAVQAFQGFEHLQTDGVVGEKTWDVRLNAADPAGDTLEKTVGLTFATV
jgi:peptidoglycan hydrolase-like protein with peptidoglycan-binding domain